MQHFELITDSIDVQPLMKQLQDHEELWGAQTLRKTFDGTPHKGMTDIWVRYNDISKLDPANRCTFNEEHVPVWYPAWRVLTDMHGMIFDLMAKVQGEMLGGVLITRIPPGEIIAPHRDDGWHVQYYDKFYISLQSEPGAKFYCYGDDVEEVLEPKAGECWLFDNRKNHWVTNESSVDRVTLIVCIRTTKFGR